MTKLLERIYGPCIVASAAGISGLIIGLWRF